MSGRLQRFTPTHAWIELGDAGARVILDPAAQQFNSGGMDSDGSFSVAEIDDARYQRDPEAIAGIASEPGLDDVLALLEEPSKPWAAGELRDVILELAPEAGERHPSLHMG